jgi:catechol-2,3-dioxygenase
VIGRLYEIVIDCPDPKGLAAFYRELTGLDELLGEDDWVTLGRGGDVRVAFQKAEDYNPPQWPDPAHPQHMHLDIFVPDLADAAAKVEALGARPLGGDGEAFRVYTDPAGHPFCLCRDDPRAP